MLFRSETELAKPGAAEALGLGPARNVKSERIAFHPPCSLQHGQKARGIVESILRRAGAELTPVADAHLCCGSAGTYSILQPELAEKLKTNKLAALTARNPQIILSANIGCMTHLADGAGVPVEHWIEYLDRRSQMNGRG